MANYGNDIASPGYIESTASSTRKSKEKLRIDSLIPSEILEDSAGMKQLLEAYYTFMNLDEFIYAENEDFQDVVLDGKAVFRISDPRNENDEFFTDEQGADSTMTVTAADGTVTTIALNDINVSISNGNSLPGSLALETSEIGKTYQVDGLSAHNASTAKLNTPIKHWTGPGPSHVLNNIERAMDIDNNSVQFLELMQKEIASVIPRNITVNKRNLYKNIVDYYKVRGSSDSIEIFFRLLFNDEVEVQYPWDKTLIPSSGNWDVNPALPRGGQYLDNKGQLSNTIKIQDSLRYQKFSYLIRTGQNVSTWENVFNRLVHPAGFKFFGEILIIMELTKAILGEDTIEGDTLYRKVLSAMPERQPGAIGIEDLPILVEMFASQFLPVIASKIHRGGTISIPNSKLKNGVINAVTVTNAGSGYLSAPVVTTADTGTPAGFTAGTFTPVMSTGGLASVTIVSGGKDYNIPGISFAAPPAIVFDGSDDESSGVGIINLVDNTIKLTAAQAAALPVGAAVTYSSGGGTSIGGLTSGSSYFIKTNTSNEVTLSATSGGAAVDITGVGSGTTHSFTGQTAAATATKSDGILTGLEISNTGFGYTSAPSITFNGIAVTGQSLVSPVVTIGIDALGRLDVDNITITSGGSGYQSMFGFVAANPNDSKLAYIELAGTGNKNYTSPPSIVIAEPTAKDALGVLLSTNVQAAAEFVFSASTLKTLELTNGGSGYTSSPTVTISGNATAFATIQDGRIDKVKLISKGSGYTTVPTVTISGGGGSGATASAKITEGEIAGYTITNPGLGYTRDPILRIDSGGHNEIRGKDINHILILLLNHVSDATSTQPANNYFNRKGNTYLNSAKVYGYNETLETLAQVQIQSTEITNINNSNVNSFIHTN
tara:strand:+ start:2420 stop:5080 length:2661 start_codon:yes stop_codon:yes gene_type:complete